MELSTSDFGILTFQGYSISFMFCGWTGGIVARSWLGRARDDSVVPDHVVRPEFRFLCKIPGDYHPYNWSLCF